MNGVHWIASHFSWYAKEMVHSGETISMFRLLTLTTLSTDLMGFGHLRKTKE